MVIGFWKRLFSDFLDAIFLAFVGFLLSLITGNLFYEIGSKGAWIGLVICFLYTGLLQTSLWQGQSLGKRILGIQVLSMDGSYLSLPKSFLRYGVLAFFVYNEAIAQMLGLYRQMDWASILYMVLVIGAFLGCFLMVPMHPLKRGLHDLVADSVVVQKGTFTKSLVKLDKEGKKRAKRAYGVWGGACLLILGIGIFMLADKPQFPKLEKIFVLQEEMSQKTAYMQVSVSLTTNYSGSGDSTTILVVDGYLPKAIFDGPEGDQEVAKAAKLAAQIMEGTKPLDGIRIVSRKGYNIGIWSFNYSDHQDFKADGTPLKE